MRCLIVQSRLGREGRTRCVVEFVRLLNTLGVEPHVLCLTSADADIGRPFGIEGLRFRLSQLLRWLPARSAFNPEILVTNFLARKVIAETHPDVVFNSNCTWAFLPDGPRYIHYIHFPFRAYLNQFPRFQGGVWKVYGKLLRLAAPDHAPPARSRFVANSELARDALHDSYALDSTIVYPPAWHGKVRPCRSHLRRVVTLGAFHPDKRQMEQVEVAARLPEWTFTLVGARGSPGYTRRVQQAARRAPNVSIVVDASRERIDSELARASHFLHTNRVEPFGIAVVEAAAAGCIPVVPDSGGVREIVESPELRFTSITSCAEVLLRTTSEIGCRLLSRVQEDLSRFSDDAFRSGLGKVLAELAVPTGKETRPVTQDPRYADPS